MAMGSNFRRVQIKKMSPDPSTLHVMGGVGRKRKRGRLKKITKE